MRFVVEVTRRWRWAGAPVALVGMALLGGPVLAQTSSAPAGSATPSVIGTTVTSTGPNGCNLATQAIFLQVSNPGAGELLPGGITVSGIAYDRMATSGSGIDRVQVFLDSRETGGIPMGSVRLNQPNPLAASGPLAQAGFTNTFSFPDNAAGAHNLVIYAHSAATQQEAVLTIPVILQGKHGGNETATPTSITAPVATCVAPAFAAATPTPLPVPQVSPAGGTVAADGQALSSQSAQTQALFRAVWGEQAAAEWAKEHNAALSGGGR